MFRRSYDRRGRPGAGVLTLDRQGKYNCAGAVLPNWMRAISSTRQRRRLLIVRLQVRFLHGPLFPTVRDCINNS